LFAIAFLLVLFSIIFKPAIDMNAGWVFVCPVDDAAFCVPLVFAVECDGSANRYIRDTGRDIDVVGDQECLVVAKADNKPLVPVALRVVTEDGSYGAGLFHLSKI
jgi:hypothetical protein